MYTEQRDAHPELFLSGSLGSPLGIPSGRGRWLGKDGLAAVMGTGPTGGPVCPSEEEMLWSTWVDALHSVVTLGLSLSLLC